MLCVALDDDDDDVILCLDSPEPMAMSLFD
jgi:hypothetical protein